MTSTTDAATRSICLALLDGLEDTAAALGLRLAAGRRAIDPALLGEIRLTVQACDERLGWLLERLPADGGPTGGAEGGRPA
jgi:hypothetical protein